MSEMMNFKTHQMTLKQLGYFGEQLAQEYLQKLHYKILETNFTALGGEIDIIAFKEGSYRFVEVKTSTSEIKPVEMINKKKISHLKHIATVWLIRNGKSIYDDDFGFDFVGVSLESESYKIKQIELVKDFLNN